jgi:hypothetical protein
MKRFSNSRKMGTHGPAPEAVQGAWIGYQLRIHGITDADIAAEVGVRRQVVQGVRYGMRTSARVQKALATALGYQTWTELLASVRRVAA